MEVFQLGANLIFHPQGGLMTRSEYFTSAALFPTANDPPAIPIQSIREFTIPRDFPETERWSSNRYSAGVRSHFTANTLSEVHASNNKIKSASSSKYLPTRDSCLEVQSFLEYSLRICLDKSDFNQRKGGAVDIFDFCLPSIRLLGNFIPAGQQTFGRSIRLIVGDYLLNYVR